MAGQSVQPIFLILLWGGEEWGIIGEKQDWNISREIIRQQEREVIVKWRKFLTNTPLCFATDIALILWLWLRTIPSGLDLTWEKYNPTSALSLYFPKSPLDNWKNSIQSNYEKVMKEMHWCELWPFLFQSFITNHNYSKNIEIWQL